MTVANGRRTVGRPRINRKRYGALLADTLPRVVETTEELERLTREIEPLLDKGDSRTAEEEELCRLVLKLIDDYQREHPANSHIEATRITASAIRGVRKASGRSAVGVWFAQPGFRCR
jgi:hypothetical protein